VFETRKNIVTMRDSRHKQTHNYFVKL